jgi:hypothetical protein
MVESDPLAGYADRTPLYGDDGELLLVFSLAADARDGRPWADGTWRPQDASVDQTGRAVVDAFAGYAFSTSDRPLVDVLARAGATEIRHAHSMSHSLHALPEGPLSSRIHVEPLTADQVTRHVARLGEISFIAYPVGHADHAHDSVDAVVEELLAIGRGELLGPYLDMSRVALVDNAIVGACLVVDRAGTPPDGGPWIIDVFRDPLSTIGGIGTALLVSTLKAAVMAGAPGLSLAVSHSNEDARRLYSALGFGDAGESWTLALPG